MTYELYDPIVVSLAASTLLFLAGTIGFGIAWIRARDRAARAERDLVRSAGGTPAGLERLEQAVDAIAIEVEWISEAERFQSGLLARHREAAAGLSGGEQPHAQPPASPPRLRQRGADE